MDDSDILGLVEWQPLARSGRSVVWQARQRSLDRLVAVKVYPSGLDEDDQRRFLRETLALGQLSDHPGIVTAIDTGILLDERPYLIMEFCSGGSLTQWLNPQHRPGEERIRHLGAQIADALAAVHALGFLHRDVKPANILLDSYGSPRLADFGLVTVTGIDSAALCCTPAYAAPEAFDLKPATEAADVFSLAATLYALLAGRPPREVKESNTLAEMAAAATAPIVPITSIDPRLMAVVMGGLSSDPAARPTAARFRDQLAEVAAPPASPQRPPVGVMPPGAFDRRRPRPPKGGVQPPAGPHSHGTGTRDPWRDRRRNLGALTLLVLLVVIAGSAAWLQRDGTLFAQTSARPSTTAPTSASTRAADPGTATSRSASAKSARPSEANPISLRVSAVKARPYETVPIRGNYRDGADTFLRVQRWSEGAWTSFPVPAKVKPTGEFTAYVELGTPGRHRLRLLQPESGVASKPFEIVIRS